MKKTLIFITSLTIALSVIYQNVFAWTIDYDGDRNFPLPPLPINQDMIFETGFVIANEGAFNGLFMAYEDEDVIPYCILNGTNQYGRVWQEVWLIATHPFDYQEFHAYKNITVGELSWGDSHYQYPTYTASNSVVIDDTRYYYARINDTSFTYYELLFGTIDYNTLDRLTASQVIPLAIANQNVPMGQYDSTIPYIIDSSIDVSLAERTSTELPDGLTLKPLYPVLSGILNSTLSDGTTYNSSQYVIDYNWHAYYTRFKYKLNFQSDSSFKATTVQDFYNFVEGSTSLNINVCNNKLQEQCASLDSWASVSSTGYSYTPRIYKLSLAVRLRDRSTGNYGPSYTINFDNLIYTDSTYKKTTGTVGITDNIDPSNRNNSTLYNDDLSEIAKGTLSYDGQSMGVSTNKGVLVDGGGYTPQADISIFSTTFGQVPQIFGAVLSFFPAWVLQFVATAFVTCIAIAIVKAIL